MSAFGGESRPWWRDRALREIGQNRCFGGPDTGSLFAFLCARSTRQQTAEGDYAYGYQWHLLPATGGGIVQPPVDAYCAAGTGGQLLVVVPAKNLVVALNSGNYEGRGPHTLQAFIQHVLPAAR